MIPRTGGENQADSFASDKVRGSTSLMRYQNGNPKMAKLKMKSYPRKLA